MNHILLYIYLERYVSHYLGNNRALCTGCWLFGFGVLIDGTFWLAEASPPGIDTKLLCWIFDRELGKYAKISLYVDSLSVVIDSCTTYVGAGGQYWADNWFSYVSFIEKVSPSWWWWLSVAENEG